MKLSTRTRYGMRLLIDLAVHYGDRPLSLKVVSERQNISLHYLHHIIAPLVSGDIVSTSRGNKGGVTLSRPPGKIRLSEIVKLLEGPVSSVDCVIDPGACSRSDHCITRDIWRELDETIHTVLESITLEQLVERQIHKAGSTYNI